VFAASERTVKISVRGDSKRSLTARIWIYLREMFPPRAAAMGLLFFASAWRGIALLAREQPQLTPVSPAAPWAAAATVVLMLLLLRIMDELKDLQTDLRLFPERPVPRGDVLVSDLRLLGFAIIAGLLGLNLFVTGAVWMFLAVLGYSLLMYRYFFLRRYMARNILFALATHNPIFYLLFLYVGSVYRNTAAPELDPGIALPLGAVFLCFSLSWEISRKIRRPEEETAYQTYSMVLGFRRALAIPVMLGAVAVTILLRLYWELFSPASIIVLLAALLMMAGTFHRVAKGRHPALRLRPATELFIVTVQLLLIVEGWLKR
jgi:4-hydroxybenzoate polyprenyltransferase